MTTEPSATGVDRPVAMITGSGAKRVGRTVAETLAAHGYAIVVHANSSGAAARQFADELQTRGTPSLAVVGDLRREADVERIVDEAASRFGRIDVLVNAAAVWKPKPLEEVTAADAIEHFEINGLGSFLMCRRVGLLMTRQSQGGAIINIGDWATRRPYANYAAYFLSKGSIPTITRMFAVELAQRNPKVRVNAVLPGPVMLPLELSAEERSEAIAGTLLKREGSPQNVADAVLALVENMFITGVCLEVDGGRSIAT